MDKPASSPARVFKTLSAVGVLAAAVIFVLVNLLVARFYKRWDWTSSGLYTLSEASIETLHSLTEPVEVIVFLSRSDPMSVSVRNMLTAYGAETRQLVPRYVDPDRNPADFLAMQQKYGIVAGKTEDGRVVTDASIVIARGDRHWYITTDDMVSYDETDGRERPKLEQALTEGIRNVLEKESTKLCFVSGQQEISIDDGGPEGLAELRYRLQKNNYDIVTVDLSEPNPSPPLEECHVVALIGPNVRVPDKVSERLASYFTSGGSVMVLSNPVLDEDNRIEPNGLAAVAKAAGVRFDDNFVIEVAEDARIPESRGAAFYAVPKPHGITNGLFKDDKPRFQILIGAAQSLSALGGSKAEPLLVTSDKAFSVKDIRPFTEQGKPVEKSAGDPSGPFTIAYAVELEKPAGSKASHGPRAVLAGTANLAFSKNWREPTLRGDQLLMESAISWLAARKTLVSVPEKASHDAGLGLTEDSLREVLRYVMIYMPLSGAMLGLFVMLRRRAKEKKSRAKSEDERKSEREDDEE